MHRQTHIQTHTRTQALTKVVEVELLDAVQHDLLLHKHPPPLPSSGLGAVKLTHPLQGKCGGLRLANASQLWNCSKGG